MSKFCSSCGAKLDENASFCGSCGAAQGSSKTESQNSGKGKGGKAGSVAAVVIILAVLIIAVKIASGLFGYNSLIKKTVTAIRDYDIDTLVEKSSDVYFFSANDDEAEIYFKNAAGNILDIIENSIGQSYKFKYETDDVYIVSDRKFESIISTIEKQYPNFDTDTISEIAIAEIEAEASRDKREITVEFDIYMTKENGTWKLYKIEQ